MKSIFFAVFLSISAFAGDKVPFTLPADFSVMMAQPDFTTAIEEARKSLPQEFDMALLSWAINDETGETIQNTVEEVGNATHDATVVVLVSKIRRNTLCMPSYHGKIVGKKVNYHWAIKFVGQINPAPGC